MKIGENVSFQFAAQDYLNFEITIIYIQDLCQTFFLKKFYILWISLNLIKPKPMPIVNKNILIFSLS